MSPLDLARAPLLAAGRHRHAPKVLIGALGTVVIVALAVGLRASPSSRAESLPFPLASSGPASLPGSGEGTIAGIKTGRFLIALSDATPALGLGIRDHLHVSLSNPTDVDLTLTTLTTTVLDSPDGRCLAEWFDADDYDAAVDDPVLIPAHRVSRVAVAIRLVNLPDVNQDACQGAGVSLTLTGTASVT